MPEDSKPLGRKLASQIAHELGYDAVIIIGLNHGERVSRHAAYGKGDDGQRLADQLAEALARAMDRERREMAMEEVAEEAA